MTTLLVKCPSVQWQPDGLTIRTEKWSRIPRSTSHFPHYGLDGKPPAVRGRLPQSVVLMLCALTTCDLLLCLFLSLLRQAPAARTPPAAGRPRPGTSQFLFVRLYFVKFHHLLFMFLSYVVSCFSFGNLAAFRATDTLSRAEAC